MSPSLPRNNLPKPGVADSKHGHKPDLREFTSCVFGSKVQHLPLREFYRGTVFSFSIAPSALSIHVLNIFKLSASAKMVRIAARAARNAGVKYEKPFRDNSSVVEHPRQFVADKMVLSSTPADAHLSIAIGFSSRPMPALVRFSDLDSGPKSFTKLNGEELLKEISGDNLSLHNSVVLICATLSGEPTPRGHFHFTPCA